MSVRRRRPDRRRVVLGMKPSLNLLEARNLLSGDLGAIIPPPSAQAFFASVQKHPSTSVASELASGGGVTAMSSSTSFAPRGATSSGGLSAGGATSGAFAPTNSASAFVTPGYDVSLTPVSRTLSLRAASGELDDDGDGDDGPWTTEDCGTNTDGDSGDDGIGGTYTWSEVDTWDIVNTTDSAGNSSYTEHDTHTYVFQESGTTPDGINYTMNYTSTDTYDASRQGDSSGSHSTSDEETDASYQDHADDGFGDTYDDGGTYHATTTGYNNSGSDGIHWGTTTSSHGEDHYTVHGEAGASTSDESGSDFATDHNESNSYWLDPFTPYSGAADQTHDDGGQDSGSMSLSDGSGDTDDSDYFDEFTDHSESQTAYDVSTGLNTYTASTHSSDDGNDHDDVSLVDGSNTMTYGGSDTYDDQSDSTTTNGVTTSNYSSNTSTKDYGDTSVSDNGGTESEGYTDKYSSHSEGGTDATGASHSSWSRDSSGNDYGDLSLTDSGFSFNEQESSNYKGHAEGGADATGFTYQSATFDDSGSHTVNMTVAFSTNTETANANGQFTDHADDFSDSSGASGFNYTSSGSAEEDVDLADSDGSEDDGEAVTFSINASDSGETDSYTDTLFGPEYGSNGGGNESGASTNGLAPPSSQPLIDWGQSPTVKGLGNFNGVQGTIYLYKDSKGNDIEVWKANSGQQFNCHGLTFGGALAPGGPYAINNISVPTLLSDGYTQVNEADAQNKDILVFYNPNGEAIHSSVLIDASLGAGKLDANKSKVVTKNGSNPWTVEPMQGQLRHYGPTSRYQGTYKIFRPK